MSLTLSKMQAHLDELAAEHNVVMLWDEETDGWAWRNSDNTVKQISTRPLHTVDESITWYFITLHEFGHLVGKGGWHNPHLLVREARAWEWCMHNALTGPTPAVKEEVKFCLGNYYDEQHKRMKKGRNVAWPTADEPFWDLLETGALAA